MKVRRGRPLFRLPHWRTIPGLIFEQLERWKNRILAGIAASHTPYLVALALIVGFVAGISAFLFHLIIDIVSHHTVQDLVHLSSATVRDKAHLLLFPALGGLIVGGLMYAVQKEDRLQGVPEVILSLLKRGGRMRMRSTFIKSWAAIITIGSGGSAGPEGPIAEMGASTGSFLGRLLTVPPPIMRMLVAGGAAGGIAASFQAPIGGVFFALEVLLSEFNPQAFSLVVLSSVTASLVSRAFLGNEAYFSAPLHAIGPAWELIFYAILGIIAGFLSKVYVRFLNGVEELFEGIKTGPRWMRPALGGLIVGGLALLTPPILGSGHDVIEEALWGRLSFQIMLALLLAKTLATSVTIGSGGVGGVFLPGFYAGAMLGGAYGLLVKILLDNFGITLVSSSGAFALVGMAALLAGSTRAPITAVIMIFEITSDYHMIIPVMIATGFSTMIARAIESSTIYTHHLKLRGIKEPEHHSVRALESTTVEEIMSKKVVTISPALPLDRLARLVETRGHSGFPVIDDKKELVGLVTFEELRHALGVEDLPHSAVVAGDLMRSPPPAIFPDQTIGEALQLFGNQSVDRLVVVQEGNPKQMVGIITQSDVLRIYRKLLV